MQFIQVCEFRSTNPTFCGQRCRNSKHRVRVWSVQFQDENYALAMHNDNSHKSVPCTTCQKRSTYRGVAPRVLIAIHIYHRHDVEIKVLQKGCHDLISLTHMNCL